MLRKSPATYLCALFILLAGCLLTSCGTTFYRSPYDVGIKKAYVEDYKSDGTKEGTVSDPRYTCFTCGQELYRIGPDYYVKHDFIYAPIHPGGYIWTIIFGDCGDDPTMKKEKWEKATYYCRLTEKEQKYYNVADYCKPLPQTGTHGPDILTVQEAQALNPVLVKRFDDKTSFLAMQAAYKLPARYSWPHYAMLPVTGATAVAVDLPLNIIGAIGFGIAAGVVSLFF